MAGKKFPEEFDHRDNIKKEDILLVNNSETDVDEYATIDETLSLLDDDFAAKADKTTQIISGDGLTGGGDLSGNRTLAISSANDGIKVNADNIELATIDALNSTSTTKPLSANQGKVLDEKISISQGGLLGGIAHNAAAPTPATNGRYVFTSAGSCSWITGGAITVSINDEVLVTYSAPSTYTYTYLAVASNFASASQLNASALTTNYLVKWDGTKLVPSTRNDNILYEIAWGTYLEANTTTAWPQIGNLLMKQQYYAQCGRYLVKDDGTAAKLNPTNSAFFTDGTTVDHSKGHTMWYSPDLYYLVTTEGGLPILWTSVIPIAGGKKAPAMCIGAYKAGMPASALVSKPDLNPTGSLTLSQFWAAAQVNGKDWGVYSYEHRKKITMQFLAEYGNTSIEAVLGVGLDGTGSDYGKCRDITTGKTISLGDASGAVNTLDSVGTTVQCVSYRGLENLYGQIWEFVQGILSDQETVYIWEGNKVANDKPPVGVNYRSQTRMTSSGGSYIDSMQLGEHFDIIPKTVGGGSTNRWADGHWSAAGGEVWLFGGGADLGSLCGLSASFAYGVFSVASSTLGARLAYYGELKLVTGAQLNV